MIQQLNLNIKLNYLDNFKKIVEIIYHIINNI